MKSSLSEALCDSNPPALRIAEDEELVSDRLSSFRSEMKTDDIKNSK